MNERRYREPFSTSYRYRRDQHAEMEGYLERLFELSIEQRQRYFVPDSSSVDAYAESLEVYRDQFRSLIGMPPESYEMAPGLMAEGSRFERIGEDATKEVFRVNMPVAKGLSVYGLYLVPRNDAKRRDGSYPLLVACHGGGGCPEAICDLDTREPYHGFGSEAAERGYAVWAPFLLMTVTYGGDEKTSVDRYYLDYHAILVGQRIVGIETYKISRSVEALLAARDEIDPERTAMAGLSYGGYFSLCVAAASASIGAAVCSGFFQSYDRADAFVRRDNVSGSDGRFYNGMNRFDLAGMAGLICPRPLMIQNGKNDTVIRLAGDEVERARDFYSGLELHDRFSFHLHDGAHEFENEAIFAFLERHI